MILVHKVHIFIYMKFRQLAIRPKRMRELAHTGGWSIYTSMRIRYVHILSIIVVMIIIIDVECWMLCFCWSPIFSWIWRQPVGHAFHAYPLASAAAPLVNAMLGHIYSYACFQSDFLPPTLPTAIFVRVQTIKTREKSVSKYTIFGFVWVAISCLPVFRSKKIVNISTVLWVNGKILANWKIVIELFTNLHSGSNECCMNFNTVIRQRKCKKKRIFLSCKRTKKRNQILEPLDCTSSTHHIQ